MKTFKGIIFLIHIIKADASHLLFLFTKRTLINASNKAIKKFN